MTCIFWWILTWIYNNALSQRTIQVKRFIYIYFQGSHKVFWECLVRRTTWYIRKACFKRENIRIILSLHWEQIASIQTGKSIFKQKSTRKRNISLMHFHSILYSETILKELENLLVIYWRRSLSIRYEDKSMLMAESEKKPTKNNNKTKQNWRTYSVRQSEENISVI